MNFSVLLTPILLLGGGGYGWHARGYYGAPAGTAYPAPKDHPGCVPYSIGPGTARGRIGEVLISGAKTAPNRFLPASKNRSDGR
jgi:hypothetical protein